LYLAARLSYVLDDPKNSLNPIDEQFIHTQFFALVDKNGYVRSIVDGLKKEELVDMQKEIDELLKE
jgi:protein SCO1/2